MKQIFLALCSALALQLALAEAPSKRQQISFARSALRQLAHAGDVTLTRALQDTLRANLGPQAKLETLTDEQKNQALKEFREALQASISILEQGTTDEEVDALIEEGEEPIAKFLGKWAPELIPDKKNR